MLRRYLKDLVKPGQTQQDAVLMRQGPAGQARTGAAGDNGDPVFVAVTHGRLHLPDIFGQDHATRNPAIGGQAIALINPA